MTEFTTLVDEWEVRIEVTMFNDVPPFRGLPHFAPSPDDYYGYTEIEFNIHPPQDCVYVVFAYLELHPDETKRLEAEAIEHMRAYNEPRH